MWLGGDGLREHGDGKGDRLLVGFIVVLKLLQTTPLLPVLRADCSHLLPLWYTIA